MSKTNITEESGVHKTWYEEAKKMTPEKLPEFITKLTTEYGHDYGTICHATSAAAVAAANAINRSPVGGLTGFQAGCIMWGFIQHWMHMEDKPLRLIDYEDMLYPQYSDKFQTIDAETWKHLQEKAAKNLAEKGQVHPNVEAHWKSIAAGVVPFGMRVAA